MFGRVRWSRVRPSTVPSHEFAAKALVAACAGRRAARVGAAPRAPRSGAPLALAPGTGSVAPSRARRGSCTTRR
jgi:hypothetical protein